MYINPVEAIEVQKKIELIASSSALWAQSIYSKNSNSFNTGSVLFLIIYVGVPYS